VGPAGIAEFDNAPRRASWPAIARGRSSSTTYTSDQHDPSQLCRSGPPLPFIVSRPKIGNRSRGTCNARVCVGHLATCTKPALLRERPASCRRWCFRQSGLNPAIASGDLCRFGGPVPAYLRVSTWHAVRTGAGGGRAAHAGAIRPRIRCDRILMSRLFADMPSERARAAAASALRACSRH